jgi:UDP-glucuronate 4-epimerase
VSGVGRTEPPRGAGADLAAAGAGTDERFLVTGAMGCIGAWTCGVLAEEGASVVGFDLGTDDRRLRLAGAEAVNVVRGDIVDREALDRVLDEHGITHVVHLAALLIPQIKANPPYGTSVNVGGTVNVFDAAKTRGLRIAYASSAAVYSQADDTGAPVANDAPGHPTTFYGVHKQACEGLARIFWQEEGVASVGIRPFIVYGPGRDSGLTASPSLAMAAAARGEGATIAFGGRTQLQFAPDAARAFVAAARAATEGARVFHLGGPAVTIAETARAIEESAGVEIGVDESTLLPFPEEFDGRELDGAVGPISWTPLREGVRRTIDRLRAAPG